MIRLTRHILLCFAAICYTGFAYGQDKLDFYQMGYGNWIIYNEGGQVDGIFPRVLNHAAKNVDIEITYHDVPFARVLREISKGTRIITAYMEADPDNPFFEDHKTLSVLLRRVDYGVLTLKGHKAKNYQDLCGKRVSFFNGASPEPGLTDEPAISIVMVNSAEQNLKVAQRKRVDAIWSDPEAINLLIRQQGKEFKDYFEDTIYSRSGYPVLIAHQQFADDPVFKRLSDETTRLRRTGELDKIAQEFYGEAALSFDPFEGAERPPLHYELQVVD